MSSNTNQRFVQDLNRLIKPAKERQSALPEVVVVSIAPVRGLGDATKLPVSNPEGISSPLKEIPGRREYYPPQLIKSSDGLFAIEKQILKSAAFMDSNGNELIIEFTE